MKTILGRKIVGYRYGLAPESGRSYNTATNSYEDGVSMAKVGHIEENGLLSVTSYKDSRKKYYYTGQVIGEGGDDEICLSNVKQVTYREYVKLLKDAEIIKTSNEIVNYIADRKIRLLNRCFFIGKTADEIEVWRSKNIK